MWRSLAAPQISIRWPIIGQTRNLTPFSLKLPADNPSPAQLVAALEAAAAGLVVIHPAGVDSVAPPVAAASQPLAELAEPLTPRENEVLQMLAGGLANKEIAARLAISEHTVKFHVASILGKLGAGSRTEAVALGIRRGIVLL